MEKENVSYISGFDINVSLIHTLLCNPMSLFSAPKRLALRVHGKLTTSRSLGISVRRFGSKERPIIEEITNNNYLIDLWVSSCYNVGFFIPKVEVIFIITCHNPHAIYIL